MILDLRKGVCQTPQYNAWVFPGGEIHVKIHYNSEFDPYDDILIVANIKSSEDIILLMLVVDTLKKDGGRNISLMLPYMPYQQADRNFGLGECFSLKTITNLINSMKFDNVTVFDPHSDVTAALLDNCLIMNNEQYIKLVIEDMVKENIISSKDDMVILSPDAGAFKKIFKLCGALGFKGEIVTCSKSRDHETGDLTIQIPKFDENKTVLIIDDICLAGNTFINIRKELSNKNVVLAVSHGIFNDNIDKLHESFVRIYSTNTRNEQSKGEKFKVIDTIL